MLMEIDELIQQGVVLKNSLQEVRSQWGTYYKHLSQDAFESWLMLTKRYINTQYHGDKSVEEFEKLAAEVNPTPKQLAKMIGILEAMKQIPQIARTFEPTKQMPLVSITNTQSQTQTQNVFIEIFMEALHEELSMKQIRDLKAIAEDEHKSVEEKKASILDRIKEFGMDTLSNIVANVLTNPTVWTMM